MAQKTYPQAIKLVLQHEGGLTNHPSDPGGITNRGITIAVARRYAAEFDWIKGAQVTPKDMKDLPLWFAEKVYKAVYWDAMNCDLLEPGVDYAIFDYGVNSGIGRAGRVLRRLVGETDTASTITEEIARLARLAPAASMVDSICDERLRYLQNLKTWPVFGKGWGRRVNDVDTIGKKIAEDLPIIGGPKLVPAPGRAIEPDKYARIRALQTELAKAGFYNGAIDGDLGPKTVRAFQTSRGLVVDGIVGRVTRPQLDATLAAIDVKAGEPQD
ncbi:MAG: peptidoglycan-binding protein [Proteobacteria bacterium]|nr:peptidoglycan-binding protein [Pseudomonadota bacterium]